MGWVFWVDAGLAFLVGYGCGWLRGRYVAWDAVGMIRKTLADHLR